MVTGKEVITSSKFQNNLWQTQFYFSFLLSITLMARTSVEVPGTLQKLLEFWTPLSRCIVHIANWCWFTTPNDAKYNGSYGAPAVFMLRGDSEELGIQEHDV